MTDEPQYSALITAAAEAHAEREHRTALDLYIQASKHPGVQPHCFYDMAVQYRALFRWQESLAPLKNYLASYPNDFRAWTNAADSLREIGNHEAALKMFEHALNLAPLTRDAQVNTARAHHNLARELLADPKRFDEVKAHAEKAVELCPNDPEFVMGLGEVQLLAGNYAEGWENWEARFLKKAAEDPASVFREMLKNWKGTRPQVGDADGNEIPLDDKGRQA